MPRKFIAPDGGWGWIIVVAYTGTNIIIIPCLQGFGLLYRDVFRELQFSATDISTIINFNSAFGLILGLFVGPLLKTFGFRKVAFVGILFYFTGFILCSTSQNLTDFIIYYGVINSVGFCSTAASFQLALNTYFNKKRNMASGLCTAVTGFGPVLMPQVFSILIGEYGVRGTALIVSGLILHGLAGALLLQPVKWHAKKDPDAEAGKELELLNPEVTTTKIAPEEEIDEEQVDKYESVDNFECHSVLGVESTMMVPVKTSENGGRGFYTSKLSINEVTLSPDATWWKRESNTLPRLSQHSIKYEKKSVIRKWLAKIVDLFDFDLLKDPGYRNIWLGMSIAFTGEINFSLMTPLILGDRGMSIPETAQLMSVLGIVDIVFRFMSPFIGERLKWPPKYMYMSALVFLIITRESLTFAYGYKNIFITCLFIGAAKGFRSVYMALVIPSYVPLEKLASASGLQTLLNGIFLLVVGPALGYLRDEIGNYNMCIHVISAFSSVTIVLWSVEYLYNYRQSKASSKPVEGVQT